MTSHELPLVEELAPPPNVEAAFRRFAAHGHCLFLDSALRLESLGRYSFLAADPFDYLEFPVDRAGALGALEQRMAQFAGPAAAGVPPFQGGAAGLLSYDLGRQLENLPRPRHDEFETPALAVGLYDVVVAWDHADGRAWIVSQGWPEPGRAGRTQRARQRLEEARTWLSEPERGTAHELSRGESSLTRPIPRDQLAPQYAMSRREGLTSNFSRAQYLAAVERAIEYIRAGDVFQVNLAQRLLWPAQGDSVALYLRLRQRNPAPFAGYFDLGPMQIASASPERFLMVRQGQVETRPIKGTRARTDRPETDLPAGDDLLADEKERAENVMIVDLLRNDLARVRRPESVVVSQLCGLEKYAYVQHLVSVIRGRLREACSPLELVRSSFPGGSVTGAPKIRAMEIIAELEPTARGSYCGSLGYLGFDGALDLNILIRTITAGRGWWQAPVGGGIVAQSSPSREYQETWEKAEGLLRALE